MTTVRKILCATDLSPVSLVAWEEAQRLARALRAEVVLASVTTTLPVPVQGYLPPDLYQELVTGGHRETQAGLERLAAAAEPGVKVTTRLETGPTAQRILEVAADEGVDLVVVGTHGRTGLGRVLIGSVADAVVRLAPCPVVTVRRRPDPAPGPGLKRICYATDLSPRARAAWPWALALAQATEAEVDVVHVTFEPVADPHIPLEALAQMARIMREHGQADVERFLEGCPLPRARLTVHVTGGVVADQIVHWARARAADLIVLGTHGWSGLLRWMLGSVAHQVIQVAPCAVLTVGPGEGREARAS